MRYRDLNTHLRGLFGERVQKIPLDAGLGCPNRDGTISREGCLFCDAWGSGTGAWTRGLSITEQIREWQERLERRFGARKFIAYFQSFTNTYGPVGTLRALWEEALSVEGVVGLSVGTRPDCVNREILEALRACGKGRLIWVEYGLQSAHDQTLRLINRGHDVAAFTRAVGLSRELEISVCAHVILGLPGETRDMMLDTARFLGSLPVEGVKIHHLYVCRGTALERLYREGRYRCLGREEYVELVSDFLERLSPDMVIHRLSGDPRPGELVAPAWSLDKGRLLAQIRETLARRHTWQGRLWAGEKGG